MSVDESESRPQIAVIPGYIYELCRRLRQTGTDTEGLLWEALRKRRLAGHRFRRQHPLGRYIADFYCAEARLVVEVDGLPHQDLGQVEYDALRDHELGNRGLRVLRIPAGAVEKDIEGTLASILRAVEG